MPARLDFSRRSNDTELLDRDDIPFGDIERNMRELDFINTWLGGHSISIAGLKQLARGRRRLSICEIGCGGGDNLRVLYRWCQKQGIEVKVTGIDKNAHCLSVARETWKGGEAEWVHSDYRDARFTIDKPDVIFSSLFCHHFNNEELIFQLRWMEEHAGLGWFINDLHRHPVAYHSIRWLTAGFSTSYLVKHDAPLSVLRGFRRKEWESLLGQALTGSCQLKWKWAFRWLVVGRKRYV
ncbi:MAG TPA: methyltransferase domain-containing protein [Puia sp.]|jgi:2-polyprenyl-3-methyl-5-hydroxy-6-metoxy-1,4-benzoquinol methylase|nr:methyltransferase domain-containing protein [Puia sp.]